MGRRDGRARWLAERARPAGPIKGGAAVRSPRAKRTLQCYLTESLRIGCSATAAQPSGCFMVIAGPNARPGRAKRPRFRLKSAAIEIWDTTGSRFNNCPTWTPARAHAACQRRRRPAPGPHGLRGPSPCRIDCRAAVWATLVPRRYAGPLTGNWRTCNRATPRTEDAGDRGAPGARGSRHAKTRPPDLVDDRASWRRAESRTEAGLRTARSPDPTNPGLRSERNSVGMPGDRVWDSTPPQLWAPPLRLRSSHGAAAAPEPHYCREFPRLERDSRRGELARRRSP